ncbi:HK97 gp10 family phage protein [Terribacillus sp. 7520-G]|uniref:HK97 gp10 family phage protein n=1 Tax=Terribacillus TaxID=459532 RepID=UPI000BA70D70|nr:HK97 gp10 family phage protein [Terribacillus sp. 7520-G]PAD38611.1 phage portal protein [Terribacillus sp. 7520-G]
MKIDGLDAFRKAMDDMSSGVLKADMELWLEGMGYEFLDIIQDEIIRTNTVDTRRLLNSFNKGDRENAWQISDNGMTLDVGTNLDYASYANDGHFTVDPAKGKDSRWVPGYWKGDRFVYDPGADTGMLLILKWIDGTNYWDNALRIFELMFEKSLEKKLQQWMDKNFGR